MTEETHNAAMSGSLGIIMAIGVSALLGWFLILGLLFSMQDYTSTIGTPTGEPVAQIFLDTVGEKGAIVLMVSLLIPYFYPFVSVHVYKYPVDVFYSTRFISLGHCDWCDVHVRVRPFTVLCVVEVCLLTVRSVSRTFSITSNSRMMYAFSRDGALPGHKFFHKVDAKRKSPIRTGIINSSGHIPNGF